MTRTKAIVIGSSAGGVIYVAQPDHHMILEGGCVLVKRCPKENRFRPSIDALFRSAAHEYGPAAIGVILTGMLDDGSSGMWSLNRMGAVTIVQNPEQALYPSMPLNVLEHIHPDHICSLSEIAPLLIELSNTAASGQPIVDKKELKLLKMEVDIASLQNTFDMGTTEMGEPTALTCPECGGALHSLVEGQHVRYRCHTGHAYSSASLLDGVTETTEQKLWGALRSLEEAVMIVEKEAAVLESAINEPSLSHSIKIRVLKKQVGELHNFLNHYLQFNEIRIE